MAIIEAMLKANKKPKRTIRGMQIKRNYDPIFRATKDIEREKRGK